MAFRVDAIDGSTRNQIKRGHSAMPDALDNAEPDISESLDQPKTDAIADKSTMADPFEVRMRFTGQLQHLNASINSAHKAAIFALKHREMDEDLHSCILEQLERNNMNNRANIMYFFEALCDLAIKENHVEFVRMMERDIARIVDLVTPEDGSGAANVKVVRKVLHNLAAKSFIQAQTVKELEDLIKDRGQINGAAGDASPPDAVTAHSNGNVRIEKRQIEQRIEEDRERHKRLREGIWSINHAAGDDEFERMWDEVSDLNEDDYRLAAEQSEERKHYVALHEKEFKPS